MTHAELSRSWRARNKEMVAAYNKAYWAARPEALKAKEMRHRQKRKPKFREYRRLYRLKNLAEVRRKNREWQQRQKIHRRRYMSKYYQEHAEQMREKSRKWARENPGKQAAHNVKRRSREAEVNPVEVQRINTWMRQIRCLPFVRCHWCGTKVKGRKIHFDHVVPLARRGEHSIANLCATCPECNLTKHTRLIADWVAGGQTFLSL